MAEYLLILVTISCLLNTVLLYKIIAKGKLPEGTDTSLYDEQIKNLKRIIRLNEKYIKDIKNKEVKDNEKMVENKQQENMVQVSEQRRIY